MTILTFVALLPTIAFVLLIVFLITRKKAMKVEGQEVDEKIKAASTTPAPPSRDSAYLCMFNHLTDKYVRSFFEDVEWWQYVAGYGVQGNSIRCGFTKIQVVFFDGREKIINVPLRKIWNLYETPFCDFDEFHQSTAQRFLAEKSSDILAKKKKAKKCGYVSFELEYGEFYDALSTEKEQTQFLEELQERLENAGYYVITEDAAPKTFRLNFQDME